MAAIPTPAECCAKCGLLEHCEAFTHIGASCRLFTAWGLAKPGNSSVAVSGEPLNQWVLRPSTLEVLVGGSSDAAVAVGVVTITGAETPLTSCPSSMPNW